MTCKQLKCLTLSWNFLSFVFDSDLEIAKKKLALTHVADFCLFFSAETLISLRQVW